MSVFSSFYPLKFGGFFIRFGICAENLPLFFNMMARKSKGVSKLRFCQV
jgi:hypothetical protein